MADRYKSSSIGKKRITVWNTSPPPPVEKKRHINPSAGTMLTKETNQPKTKSSQIAIQEQRPNEIKNTNIHNPEIMSDESKEKERDNYKNQSRTILADQSEHSNHQTLTSYFNQEILDFRLVYMDMYCYTLICYCNVLMFQR
jgi:hypothetical protein